MANKDHGLEPDRCAKMLKAMADPERLRIVQCLRSGPQNVSDLAEQLHEDIVKVSHHLKVLRQSGIVLDQRQGRFVIYCLHPDVFRTPQSSRELEHLDFGCCRIELPKV